MQVQHQIRSLCPLCELFTATSALSDNLHAPCDRLTCGTRAVLTANTLQSVAISLCLYTD